MEFRVLKYFLTMVNENNITRAAEVLHITQPTLSRQLMDLEEELGTEESHLHVVANYTLLSNVVLLVQERLGCAICLDGALAIGNRPEITFVPLTPEHTTRSVFLWKKNRMFSPAASLFIQMIKQGL